MKATREELNAIKWKLEEIDRNVKKTRISIEDLSTHSGMSNLKKNTTIQTKTDKGKKVLNPQNRMVFPFSPLTGATIDTCDIPILQTRKPDCVGLDKDWGLDPLNVEIVFEIKPQQTTCFTNQDVGEMISFAEKVLHLQPQRHLVYGVLTDCHYIQIFEVKSENFANEQFKSKFTSRESLAYKGNESPLGWKWLVTLLSESSYNLGWMEPELRYENNRVKLECCLGAGRTSVVFRGSYNGQLVAVKVLKHPEKHNKYLDIEYNVIKNLTKDIISPNLPHILFKDEISLVITPLCDCINHLKKDDISPILSTLEKVHKYESGCPVLIDWGFSITNKEKVEFCGGIDCAADEVLEKIKIGEAFEYKPEYDLISFICSIYIMLHAPEDFHCLSFDNENLEGYAGNLADFWCSHSVSELWKRMHRMAYELDYQGLIDSLEQLF
nr:7735_t:CDS:2 [Entrophospora candida]